MPTTGDDVLETVLVHCWESALRRGPIGVHDDFFAAGGHSLAAMRIAHRIRSIFGIEVHYLAVLDCLTVAAQARHLRELATSASELDEAGRAYLSTHAVSRESA
ncbi:phosphopantetheine-binding protein [Actinoplanes sp. NPDC024001]|uniref:phosphopantetheine-binding protein n=1 Tax=Actinoplanes sp. NPDC024001 TaxID=3154598 RepID=UPI0033CF5A14